MIGRKLARLAHRCTGLAVLTTLALIVSPARAQRATVEHIPILHFRLELNRLDPPLQTVPPGRYYVKVSNGLVIAALRVQLDHENGQRLIAKDMPRRSIAAEQLVTLNPGKHTLQVLGKPQWTSIINVVPGKK